MATKKWVDEGENRVLNILLGAQAPDNVLYLGLLTNITEPGETATLASLTEPSGFGYAREPLNRGEWTIVADLATYEEQVMLASGGDWGDIYGYFIATSSDASGKLLAVVYFDTALEVVDGKGMKITPKFKVA
jgi:hypothetical protein